MLRLFSQRSPAGACLRSCRSLSCGAAQPSLATSGVVLDGAVPQTADFKANMANMDGLLANLTSTIHKIQEGGGAKAIAKHRQRNKLLARERINALVDVGSPFLEMSPLAGYAMYDKTGIPAGGIVTGIGKVLTSLLDITLAT
jgi:3-methylcrotonyl-CoA carboxylase beta subunit